MLLKAFIPNQDDGVLVFNLIFIMYNDEKLEISALIDFLKYASFPDLNQIMDKLI